MDITQFFQIGMDRYVPLFRPDVQGLQLNLGGGEKIIPGVENVAGIWDANLDKIPYGDNLASVIWSLHFFEHIKNFHFCLAECQRVLMPGGVLNVVVPYGTCHMAVQDSTHVRFFNEDTWKELFWNKYYNPFPNIKWQFYLYSNFIMGVDGRNLALFTQLVKMSD